MRCQNYILHETLIALHKDCTVSVSIKGSPSDILQIWDNSSLASCGEKTNRIKEIMKTTSTIALGILAVLMLQTKVVFPLAEAEMDPFTSDEAEMELSAWAEAEMDTFTSDEAEMELSAWAEAEMDTFIEEAETELEPAEAETELEPAEAETELEPAEAETESSTSAEMETYPVSTSIHC